MGILDDLAAKNGGGILDKLASPPTVTRTEQIAKGAEMTPQEQAEFNKQRAEFQKTGGDMSQGEVGGVPKWGRDHPNLYALYKTATGGIDLDKPTEKATGAVGWATRVVPESAVKTVLGAVTAPYHMIKNITDPMVDYAANITNADPNRKPLAKGIEEGIGENLKGVADFAGKPLGFKRDDNGDVQWSLANIGEALATDPVGTAVAAIPYVGAGKGIAGEVSTIAKTRLPKVESLTATIDNSFNKAVRPGVAGNRTLAQSNSYKDNARTAVKEIVLNKDNLKLTDEAGNPVEGLPQNLGQFRQAIDSTKKALWSKVGEINTAAGNAGAEVPLYSAAKELKDLGNNPAFKTMSPELVKYAENRAKQLTNQGKFDVPTAQEALSIANQSADMFYRNPSPVTASRAYVDALVANHLRTSLDAALEASTGTPAAAPLRKAYGALKSIEKDVNQRATVDARKNQKGLIDFSDIFTAGELVGALAKLNGAGAASAGTSWGVKTLYRHLNNPNTHVQRVFKAADKLVSKAEFAPPAAAPSPTPQGVALTGKVNAQGPLPSQVSNQNLAGSYVQPQPNTMGPVGTAGSGNTQVSTQSLAGILPPAPVPQQMGPVGGTILESPASSQTMRSDLTTVNPSGPTSLTSLMEGINVGKTAPASKQVDPYLGMRPTPAESTPAKPHPWREFVSSRMAQVMKEEGNNHGAAMKRLAKEYAQMKKENQ